jgi:phosphate acetyltransferase
MNVLIAKNLGSHYNCWLCVGKTLEELIDSLYLAYDSFKVREVEVLLIATKVQPENIKLVTNGLKGSSPKEVLVNAFHYREPKSPTIKEIVVKAMLWWCILNNEIGNYSVGAMKAKLSTYI